MKQLQRVRGLEDSSGKVLSFSDLGMLVILGGEVVYQDFYGEVLVAGLGKLKGSVVYVRSTTPRLFARNFDIHYRNH